METKSISIGTTLCF